MGMGKETELRSKPDTSLIPQENMKACNQPLFKCVWSWGDGSYTAHGIGGSKKLAEHTATQMMLAAMFPHDWSFGYMYEYIKSNYSKKRKRDSDMILPNIPTMGSKQMQNKNM